MVSPPFLRLGTGPSGATLEQRMPRERLPNQSAHTAIMGSMAADHDLAPGRPLAPDTLQAWLVRPRRGDTIGVAPDTAALPQWSLDRTGTHPTREAAASRPSENNQSGK